MLQSTITKQSYYIGLPDNPVNLYSLSLPQRALALIHSSGSTQMAGTLEKNLRELLDEVWSSVYLTRQSIAFLEEEQKRIHNRLATRGLIRPARKRWARVKPPLLLEGKPLSDYLDEVRG